MLYVNSLHSDIWSEIMWFILKQTQELCGLVNPEVAKWIVPIDVFINESLPDFPM